MRATSDPFRVGIVPGVTVMKWTRAWKDRRPDAPLEVIPLEREQQREALDSGLVDVCFVRLPIDREDLNVIRLYGEVPVVVVSKEHPVALFDSVTLADLAGETVRRESPADAIEIVAAGAGVYLAPHSIARQHSRKDVVAVPIADAEQTEIAIAWPIDATTDDVEFFVGIVRGRTASSSRGTSAEPEPTAAKLKPKTARAPRATQPNRSRGSARPSRGTGRRGSR